MFIPFCDLKTQYLSIRDEVLSAIDQLCLESAFIKGPYVSKFEKEFIEANKSQYGVGCSNGTAAISLALEALGIGKEDEVILPAHTFMATAEAICHVGAIPIFADIKPDDYTIDPKDIEKKITKKTKAIIPVHIYGTPCDMDEIMTLAKAHNLKVIEDCAQAHFANYKGQYIGTFGEASTFSFYPGKNLGAYGDAGFILCRNEETEKKLRRLIDHGRSDKFDHEIVGYNQRLDALQAAILSIKLKRISKWTSQRKEIAKNYEFNLKKMGLKTIQPTAYKDSVYHVYIIEVANRDKVKKFLLDHGIQTGIHYPEPVHMMKPFQYFSKNKLPVTETIKDRILSLPIYPELGKEDQQQIIKTLKKSLKI